MKSDSYMPKSKSDDYITPDRVFDYIYDTWGLLIGEMYDPCPIDFERDGLEFMWKKHNYVNPPYSLLNEFVNKAIEQSKLGAETIMLLPSKTDQKFFHILIRNGYTIKWIRKRLKFEGEENNSPQTHFLVLIK